MSGYKNLEEMIAEYPGSDPAAAAALLEAELEKDRHKVVVLDDDPTGVQTVHGLSVYTDGSEASVAAGFDEPGKMFFILTNSRSLSGEETRALHADIAGNVLRVAKERGRPFLIVSRSDSTLRGHYPLETQTIRDTIQTTTGRETDGEIVCPYFHEGGRLTIDGVHYVVDNGRMIPAGDTEFSKDRTFGYESSDLRDWIEEKTEGAFPAGEVTLLPLKTIRALDVESLTASLMSVSGFGKVVVDAMEDADVQVVAAAVLRATRAGKTFLFRSAAGLVRVLGGVSHKPVLTPGELLGPNRDERVAGGLVVVGSHVAKTTAQLNRLLEAGQLTPVEFDVRSVVEGRENETADRLSLEISGMLAKGRSAVVYTTREVTAQDGSVEDDLRFSVRVSRALVRMVAGLTMQPRFLVAKGGITSSDIGVHALGVKRATVTGQALPGVPVWQLGDESRFPGLSYVVFPGNVGDEDALRRLVEPLLWGHARQVADFADQPGETDPGLPDVMAMPDGLTATPENWKDRRAGILDLLSREEYGYAPPAPTGVRSTVTGVANAYGGKATHTSYSLSVDTPSGEFSFPYHLITPASDTRAPVFLHIAFHPDLPDVYSPVEEIIDRGFALASFCYQDVSPDADDGFSGGLAGCFPADKRGTDTWGKISLWAWAASRVMDDLQNRAGIDKERVAVVGHSRLGKTSLWAGVQDTRFAMVVCNAPGCGGSAITRGKKGEHIHHITKGFGYWFCDNFKKYAGHEDSMPFDQHFLLACVAPRLLYNGSALQDEWSDPLAEFHGCVEAGPAYRILGVPGLTGPKNRDTCDPVRLAYHEGRVGFHLREGGHFFSRTDWVQIMTYWKRHMGDTRSSCE